MYFVVTKAALGEEGFIFFYFFFKRFKGNQVEMGI